MKRTEVLLVEHYALVRAGLKALIDRLDGFVVCAEAANPQEAMRLLETRQPRLVVADLSPCSPGGWALLHALRAQAHAPPVVILSTHGDNETVAEALRLGAAGYVLKDATPGELETALRAAGRNESYVSPAVFRNLVGRQMRRSASPRPEPLSVLTARQIQILTMIASRKGTKEIAYELALSEKTITAHRAQIMQRTGVRDLVGLVLLAVKHGLVSVEQN